MSAARSPSPKRPFAESLALPIGLVMLVLWAVVTFALEGPGWIHLFLTLGVFFVVWGIVARGTPEAERTRRPGRPAGGP